MATIPTQLRQRTILDAQLMQCRQVENSFARGAAGALHWLTRGGPGPLTGALTTSITFPGIVHELAAAEAIIYGPRSTGREYARGVEHALLWAENATAGPPVPTENRSRSDRRDEHSGSAGGHRPAEPELEDLAEQPHPASTRALTDDGPDRRPISDWSLPTSRTPGTSD